MRTGDFKLRLAALRRIAPIFCGYGKDRYQWLVSVHLSHMARMTDDDMKALSHMFSTSLGGDAHARIGLDERQEFANRLYKGSTMKITKLFVCKLAAIVTLRERALAEVRRKFFVTGKDRDPGADVLRKRRAAVETAIKALVGGLAFSAKGEATLMSLDGREALLTEADEILAQHAKCDRRWEKVVQNILGDTSAPGCTKLRMKSFPPRVGYKKPAKKAGKPSAVLTNLKNTGESANELHKVLNGIAANVGSATQKDVERIMLEIGSTVPLCMANIEAGVRNKVRCPPHDCRTARIDSFSLRWQRPLFIR